MAPRPAVSAIALLLLAGALAGCAGGGDAHASFYVKDKATASFREVHILLTQAAIHQAGNDSAGWRVLYSGSTDVDLLNTSGAKAAFLGEATLPSGKYQQLRLTASSAYGIDTNGTRVDIALPDKELKVVKGFRLEAGQETALVLDLDLERSLKPTAAGWEFKPVVGKLYAMRNDTHGERHVGQVAAIELGDDAAQE